MKKLLLLHGALQSSATFDSISQKLDEVFEIYRPDFAGHAHKPFPETPLSIPVLADHLSNYMAEFHLTGCPVFGYSMGGYVALHLEAERPGTFSGIMTYGTRFAWNAESAAKEIKLLVPEKMLLKIPAYCSHLEKLHGTNWKRLVLETAHLIHHIGQHPIEGDTLNQITCPVRISLGDRDALVSLSESERIRTLLSNASLSVLALQHHELERVDPDRLVYELTDFIKHGG